jgi:hypothetical protein
MALRRTCALHRRRRVVSAQARRDRTVILPEFRQSDGRINQGPATPRPVRGFRYRRRREPSWLLARFTFSLVLTSSVVTASLLPDFKLSMLGQPVTKMDMRALERDGLIHALQPQNAPSATRLGGAQVEPFLTAVAPEAAPSLSFVQTRYPAARPGAAVVMAGEF